KDRVDIDKLQPENVNPPEVTGGYALKIDRLDPGDSGSSVPDETLPTSIPRSRKSVCRSARRNSSTFRITWTRLATLCSVRTRRPAIRLMWTWIRGSTITF